MKALVLSTCLMMATAGCGRIEMLEGSVVDERRAANDLQARLTVAATCDLSIGSMLRELTGVQAQHAMALCASTIPGGGR